MAAGAFAITVGGCTAPPPPQPQQQAGQTSQNKVYILHSVAQGSCPALDWYIVAKPGGTLGGILSWNEFQDTATITGTFDQQKGTFQMHVLENQNILRTATIDGTINPQTGWLTANVHGLVVCRTIQMPWVAQPSA
jgi:hypothetical protein